MFLILPVISSLAKKTPPNVPLPIGSMIDTSTDEGTILRFMDVDANGDDFNDDSERCVVEIG